MFNVRVLLKGYPEIIQFVVVLGIVLVLVYLCLILTRWIGKKSGGPQVHYDDPVTYEKNMPKPFGGNFWENIEKKRAAKEAAARSRDNDQDKQ